MLFSQVIVKCVVAEKLTKDRGENGDDQVKVYSHVEG